ncbi:MAG: hypothetical protein P0Y56_01740 [Candidatus Andeanibacterium colombiense]|uniref:Cobalamin biosynthesis protein CobT VWA domain-containing protein n=1 Tax=Candidatus Andeanibacterium colombiense TaxID=3121345 RepID=A0AAJ6BPV0_9SPHN|nr:MAG: hypothetical protein P0Y56_01740 [Sphingomonadaceae bacterium]
MLLSSLALFLRSRRRRIAADDPERPYSVYSREFDVECRGSQVVPLLERDGTRFEYPARLTVKDEAARRTIALTAEAEAAPVFAARAEAWGALDWSVAFLIDQSGSMADRMPTVAGQLKALTACLTQLAIPSALFGYTSRGWRGGKARQLWVSNGRPRYPGRLCALLHITYKKFDAPLQDEDWQALLLPDVLRENIDGEAIEWAANLLEGRGEKRRLLVVCSDGAPVDDSTLAENGAGILSRHLQAVVERIANENTISLGAIGIAHRVETIYPIVRRADDPGELPQALADVLDSLLRDGKPSVSAIAS